MTRPLAVAALALAFAPSAHALNDNPHGSAFVTLYQCDGNKWIAAAYPAWNAKGEPPVRVSWNGDTVVMNLARSGSGSRYVSKAADLEWWIKGREATMFRLSNHSVLLNCREG